MLVSDGGKYSLVLLGDDEDHFVLCFYLSREVLVGISARGWQSQGMLIVTVMTAPTETKTFSKGECGEMKTRLVL